MSDQQALTQGLEKLYNRIEQYLHEGEIYYSMPIVNEYQDDTDDDELFIIKDELLQFINEDFASHDFKTSWMSELFPASSRLKLTIQKGQAIKVEVCSPEMQLDYFKLHMITQMKNYKFDKVEGRGKVFINDRQRMELDLNEEWHREDKMIERSGSRCFMMPNARGIFALGGGKIQKLHYVVERGEMQFYTSPAIPNITSEVVDKQEDLTINPNDLNAIYAFLESFSEQKIKKALELLSANPDFYAKAEKRYLNLVRAQLNDPNAKLEQFAQVDFKKKEIQQLTGNQFAKDFMSLSYFYDSESKILFDFVGSLVKNQFNIDDFIADAKQCKDEQELYDLYYRYAKPALQGILAQAEDYPEGWFSKTAKHLAELNFTRVMFEKTKLEKANKSLVLREFVFFFNIKFSDRIYLDIYQSTSFNLTEMFWLLPEIPKSNWGDTTIVIPNSPLPFKRVALVKAGDTSNWKEEER